MAKMTVSGFRREAEKLRAGRSRGSARYPARLKAFALRYAEAQRAKGRPRAQVAKDLGLCDVTLYGWQKERDAVPGRLAPVTVADAPEPAVPVVEGEAPTVLPPATGEVSVTTPDGYRVDGLTPESAVALLRALA